MDKSTPFMDKFNNFAELARYKEEGRDYTVTMREAHSNVAIVAPHGGIETNAAEMAEAIAADDHNLYVFRALEGSGGFAEMHITSIHFDEPRCLDLVAKTDVTLTIHASRFREEVVCLSAMDKKLESKLAAAFNAAGIKALIEDLPYQTRTLPENISNMNRQGQGVQMEFSQGIRDNPALRETCVRVVRDTLKIK
jgi:phage replication-related protein YjqB (UPF0714/DUF867 family)